MDFLGFADQLNEIFDPSLGKPLVPGQNQIEQSVFYNLVQKYWSAPVDPTPVQTAEFYNLWNATPHDQAAAVLVARGFSILKDITAAPPGSPRQHRLLGAISSLAMVLTVKTLSNDVGYFGVEGGEFK